MYFAAIASSRQSFLSNSFSFRHSFKPKFSINLIRPNSICCKSTHHDDETDSSRKNGNQLAKLAIATLAVGVLALGSVGDASAAKSGGRIGGQAFRSSAPRPPPRINNRSSSRTNIYVNPQVAPPLIGGYGYGYGGYGWSPFSFFAPGPAVAVGVGGGFDLLLLFMFFGAASAVARNFFRSRNDDDEDDY